MAGSFSLRCPTCSAFDKYFPFGPRRWTLPLSKCIQNIVARRKLGNQGAIAPGLYWFLSTRKIRATSRKPCSVCYLLETQIPEMLRGAVVRVRMAAACR
jgi:hypothetical protein